MSPSALELRATQLAHEIARKRSLAARLAGRTFPTYAEIHGLLALAVGDGLLHAQAGLRGRLERAARRFDRYALRLTDAGHPTPAPTALAWLLADTDRLPEQTSVQSAGYFAARLDTASKLLRARWRELDPDDTAAKERRRQRRLQRRRDVLGRRLGDFRTGQLRRDFIAHGAEHLAPDDFDRHLAELDRQAAEHRDALADE